MSFDPTLDQAEASSGLDSSDERCMNVRVAQSACLDPGKDLAPPRLRNRQVADLQRCPQGGNEGGFHEGSF